MHPPAAHLLTEVAIEVPAAQAMKAAAHTAAHPALQLTEARLQATRIGAAAHSAEAAHRHTEAPADHTAEALIPAEAPAAELYAGGRKLLRAAAIFPESPLEPEGSSSQTFR